MHVCISSLRNSTRNWYYLLPTTSSEGKPFKYAPFPSRCLAFSIYYFEVFLPSHSNSTHKLTNVTWSYPICSICKRYPSQLLRDILLERSNSAVMVRYVSSKEHLMIHMNLLRVKIFFPCILITQLPNHPNHAQPPCYALLVLQFCVPGRMRSPGSDFESHIYA